LSHEAVIYSIFLVFTGAAVVAAIALFARQSLLVAYITLGGVVGPHGFALVSAPETIEGIGHVGIIFLLYLLGLNLHPQKLLRLLREVTLVTLVTCIVFAAVGIGIGLLTGFSLLESALIGAAMMFSSTILGLKLLPTTALHHRHVGEIIISVLLLQDIIAIFLLLLIEALGRESASLGESMLLVLALPALAGVSIVFARTVLVRLMSRFDTIQEYIFLTAIGWCLGIAQLGHWLGLSYEMGAFIAGVALASSPIATFVAESLKPLRDFFLIMFFFALGAGFQLDVLPEIALPAALLAGTMLVLKPVVFRVILMFEGETAKMSTEVGMRLGQISEFSLLIAALALSVNILSDRASYLIQAATLFSFVVSSYVIMLRYPTPIAVTDSLRRD
jgi:Kef-type K+ transport system membrane component KefB